MMGVSIEQDEKLLFPNPIMINFFLSSFSVKTVSNGKKDHQKSFYFHTVFKYWELSLDNNFIKCNNKGGF